MDFGADLDDDLFEETIVKRINSIQIDYEAKMCDPTWFLNDDSESTLSYRADYLYYTKQFDQSADLYKKCIEIYSKTNNLVSFRDCLENCSRCYLAVGKPQEALKHALNLDETSNNPDQKAISKNLLAIVYHQLKEFDTEAVQLEICLKQHPTNPDLWLRLAYAYSNANGIDLPPICGIRGADRTASCPEMHSFTQNCPCIKCPCLQTTSTSSTEAQKEIVGNCLVKAKFHSCGPDRDTFATQRHKTAYKRISEVMNQIKPDLI